MSNFKSAAKRKRELAKLDKRAAKDQKRAVRKAERSVANVGAATPTSATVVEPALSKHAPALGPPPVRKPMTLAEAVEKWRSTKVGKPKRR
jgi:hypothetical protein